RRRPLRQARVEPGRYTPYERCGRSRCPATRRQPNARPPLPVRRRDRLPLPAVAWTRNADRLQRRAALREAVTVARSRPWSRDPRTALLLPGAARAARPVARLAALLDDRRVRRGEAARRRGHVRRRLPGLLPRAAGRPALVCARHRGGRRRDAGDALSRLPHVGGARVSGVPLRGARARARGGTADDRRPAPVSARPRATPP